MSSSANQYFQNSQYYQQFPPFMQFPQNMQYYTPLINVPTMNRLPTHGELVASMELLRATVGELSRKIDRIDSRVNDWVNLSIAERMMNTEKCISSLNMYNEEHSNRLHIAEEEIDELFGYLKDLKENVDNNDKCIERFSDILSEHTAKLRHTKHKSRDLTKKCAEIGILRRRISKCEDFNTEFAECFEEPLQLRGIISHMSDKVDECDRTISYMIRYANEVDTGNITLDNTLPGYSTFCEGFEDSRNADMSISSSALDEYFSNYCENEDVIQSIKNENENENAKESVKDEIEDVLSTKIENININTTDAQTSDDEFVEI